MSIRDKVVQLRLTADEATAFKTAARISGLSLSAWVRERIRQSAIRELENAGRRVAFVEEIPLGG